MQRCGSELQKGPAMQGRAIAGVTLEAVPRMDCGQAGDERVAGLLGEDAGGGNRQALAVAADHGALGATPATQGQHTIHQHQLRRNTAEQAKALQGTEHGPLGGGADAMAVDVFC